LVEASEILRSVPPGSPEAPASIADQPGYRRVALRVRHEIVNGIVPAGGWLRLQAVAERCNVSIQPVREALQLLEGEGLVQIFPNRGAQVRGIDRQRLVHIYEIREAVESMLTRRFCEEASLSDLRYLAGLQAKHDATTTAEDAAGTSAANYAFHHFINSRSGNAEGLAIAERYYDLGRTLHQRFRMGQPAFERSRQDHHRLLDAFQRRDCVAAAEISAKHIRATVERLLASIDAADPNLVPANLRAIKPPGYR
jgi:DNA-binding GntR family transcriptional regulator